MEDTNCDAPNDAVTPSLLCPNIDLTILCPSLNFGDQVSHPYKMKDIINDSPGITPVSDIE
jgi:hypothetical protein